MRNRRGEAADDVVPAMNDVGDVVRDLHARTMRPRGNPTVRPTPMRRRKATRRCRQTLVQANRVHAARGEPRGQTASAVPGLGADAGVGAAAGDPMKRRARHADLHRPGVKSERLAMPRQTTTVARGPHPGKMTILSPVARVTPRLTPIPRHPMRPHPIQWGNAIRRPPIRRGNVIRPGVRGVAGADEEAGAAIPCETGREPVAVTQTAPPRIRLRRPCARPETT